MSEGDEIIKMIGLSLSEIGDEVGNARSVATNEGQISCVGERVLCELSSGLIDGSIRLVTGPRRRLDD